MLLSRIFCDALTKHKVSLLYDKEKASVQHSLGKTSVELTLVCSFEKCQNVGKYFVSQCEVQFSHAGLCCPLCV